MSHKNHGNRLCQQAISFSELYSLIRQSDYAEASSMVNPELDELNLLHARVCQALGDPKRFLILYAIHEKPRRLSIVAEDLGLLQPTVSRHLSILRQRSLVSS